jgi:hypothetical protein
MKIHKWNWEFFLKGAAIMGVLLLAYGISKGTAFGFMIGAVLTSTLQKKSKGKPPKVVKGDDAQLHKAMESITQGKIAFVFPDTMTVGQNRVCSLLIAKELSQSELAQLAKFDPQKVEDANVGTYMQAKLSGEAFAIHGLSEEKQFVRDQGWTQWEWDVTPQKAGLQTLEITVTIRLKLPKSEEYYSLPSFAKNIDVAVNLPHLVWKIVQNGAKAGGENWKELSTLGFLGGAGYVIVKMVSGWNHSN